MRRYDPVELGSSRWGAILFWTCWFLFRFSLGLFRPPIVIGRENVRGIEGATIMAKHESNWDFLDLSLVVRTRPVLKRELYDLFPFLLALGGALRLDRGNVRSAATVIRAVIALIKQGWNILVFPEGTRTPGEVGPVIEGTEAFAKKAQRVIFVGVCEAPGWRRLFRRPVLVFSRPIAREDLPIALSAGWLRHELSCYYRMAQEAYER